MSNKVTNGIIITSVIIGVAGLLLTVVLLMSSTNNNGTVDSAEEVAVNEVTEEVADKKGDVNNTENISARDDSTDTDSDDSSTPEENEQSHEKHESIIPKEEYEPYMGDDGHFHRYGDFRDDIIDGMIQDNEPDPATEAGPASIPEYWDSVEPAQEVPADSDNTPTAVAYHLVWFKEERTEIYQCYLAARKYWGISDDTLIQSYDVADKEHRFQVWNFGFKYDDEWCDVFLDNGVTYLKHGYME